MLLCFFAFSQSDAGLQQVQPKWKLGDQRKVHTRAFSKVYIKDSLFNSTETSSVYNIKVVDTSRNYTLLYYKEPQSQLFQISSTNAKVDSAANVLSEIVKQIEKQTSEFKYELLIDKNTGQAIKVKNSEAYLRMIEQVTSTMIDEAGKKKGKTEAQIDSMKRKTVAYFKLSEPKILETTINEFNYVVQPYSYSFRLNATITREAMIRDVNALGDFGDVEMPALLTISSKKDKGRLIVQTDTDYDKDFLLKQIKKKRNNLTEVAATDLFLTDKVETGFAIESGWIVSHKSSLVFKMKDVRVVNETVVSFE